MRGEGRGGSEVGKEGDERREEVFVNSRP